MILTRIVIDFCMGNAYRHYTYINLCIILPRTYPDYAQDTPLNVSLGINRVINVSRSSSNRRDVLCDLC